MTERGQEPNVLEIVYYVASSLDGFLAPPDGGLEWLAPFERPDVDYGYASFYAMTDAVILGSRTYEQALGFEAWPYPGKRTVVMSARDLPAPHADISIDSRAPQEVVDWLEASGHMRAWLVGGGRLAGSFQRAGLISEYIISVIPVLLGAGTGLFDSQGTFERLELVETTTFPGGVVQLRYRLLSPRPDMS